MAISKQNKRVKIPAKILLTILLATLITSACTERIYPKVPVIKLNYDGAISAQTMNKKATGHPIQLAVDAPVNGNTVKGNITVSGWAVSFWGNNKIEILKADNSLIGTAQYGLERSDINEKYPGYVNGEKSGFSYTLDTTKFPEGTQVIRVRATASNGETRNIDVSVNVKNIQPKPLPKAPSANRRWYWTYWDHDLVIKDGVIHGYDELFYAIQNGIPIKQITNPEIDAAYNKAKEIVSTVIKPGMTEFQKEKALHDYLVTHVVYNDKAFTPGGSRDEGIYGALIKGTTICGGYAGTLRLLLNMSGIECMVIRGFAGPIGGTHAWLIVKIDGKLYHVDPTWDDAGDHAIYYYFNLTDDEIKKDHQPDPGLMGGMLPYPVCNTPFPRELLK